MTQKLTLLAERRQKLIEKAAAQRTALSQTATALQKPLAIADRGFKIIRYFKQHPFLMLTATTLIGFIRPTHLSKWLKAGASAFQLIRNARGWLSKN